MFCLTIFLYYIASTLCQSNTTSNKCEGNQTCPVIPATEANNGSITSNPKPQLHCDNQWRCPASLNERRFSPLNCSCLENCGIYGDCCYDALVSSNITSGFRSRPNIQCINPLPTGYATLSYLMVTGCPATWGDQEIRELCTSIDVNNTYQTLPVVSVDTHLTYRNIYCASCNNITHNIVPWKVQFRLQNCSSKIDSAPLVEILNGSKIIGYYPPNDTLPNEYVHKAIRFCNVSFNSECPLTTVEDIRFKCKTYFAPVEVDIGTSIVLYKNEFCAFCGGHSAPLLRCADQKRILDASSNILRQKDDHGSGSSECGGFEVHIVGGSPGFGFERLIDIDFSKDNELAVKKCENGYTPVNMSVRNKGKPGNRAHFQCVKSWRKKKRGGVSISH